MKKRRWYRIDQEKKHISPIQCPLCSQWMTIVYSLDSEQIGARCFPCDFGIDWRISLLTAFSLWIESLHDRFVRWLGRVIGGER